MIVAKNEKFDPLNVSEGDLIQYQTLTSSFGYMVIKLNSPVKRYLLPSLLRFNSLNNNDVLVCVREAYSTTFGSKNICAIDFLYCDNIVTLDASSDNDFSCFSIIKK